MSEPRVSVIIPARNKADKIGQCLEAIFSQSYKPYEVIIVDGHSTDGTAERAQRFPVKIFYQDYGAAGAARQIGVDNAEGEYVAFTDADCIPPHNWLEGLLAEFDEGIVGVGGGFKHIGKGFWTQSINLAFTTFLGSGRQLQGRVVKDKRFVKNIGCFNNMYRREAIMEVGGFNIHLSGADETELNRRLIKLKKGKLLYVPSAVVLHDHGRGLKEFAKNMYHYGGWRRECRVWGLPAIPPLIAPFLLLTLIVNYWILLALISSYLVITGAVSLRFALQERDARYSLSIPIVYIVEHLCYTIGFWKEVFRPHKMREGQPQ